MKKNIIHSVQVEINTTSIATANAIKNSIDDVIKNELFPCIEKLLEHYQMDLGANESLQIEALELDLTIEKSKLNSPEMVSAFTEQLERSLLNIIKQQSPTASKISEEYLIDVQHPLFSTRSLSYHEKNLEAFFFFIRTGTKPWWMPNSIDLKKVLEPEVLSVLISQNKKAFVQGFLKEFQRENSRNRIVAQFSNKALVQFVNDCFSTITNKELEQPVLADMEQKISRVATNEQTRKLVWELIFQHIMESSTGTMDSELESTVEAVFKKITGRTDFSNLIKASEAKQFTIVAEMIVQFLFTLHQRTTVKPREIRAKIKSRYEEWMEKKNILNSLEVHRISAEVDKTSVEADKTSARVDKTGLEVDKTSTEVHQTNVKVDKTSAEVHQTSVEVDKTGAEVHQTSADVDKTSGEVHQTSVKVDKTDAEVHQTSLEVDKTSAKKTEQNTSGSHSDEKLNSTAMETAKKTEQKTEQLPVEQNRNIRIPSDGLHVDHAGLILLYPFLGHFFKHIGLIDDRQKLLDPELAAHILHYIATGMENDWEFELVFEKYLVGIQIDEPLSKDRIITNLVKEEVDSMLKAVKSNWKPMMNSSNDLLQYEFLQRPGKLVVDGQHQRLVMEKKTQDILLNQLTWTISIVRFPWRDELIYVEW